MTAYAGISSQGAITETQIVQQTAPTITQGGTAGSTSASYSVVCWVLNNGSFAGATGQSPTGSTSTGNATLSGTNYNLISWPAIDGCGRWEVLKYVGYSWESLATNISIPFPVGTSTRTFKDTGQTPQPYTLPARNSTGDVTIAGGQVAITAQWPGVACFGANGVLFSNPTAPCPTPTASASPTATATSTATATP